MIASSITGNTYRATSGSIDCQYTINVNPHSIRHRNSTTGRNYQFIVYIYCVVVSKHDIARPSLCAARI